MLTAIYYPEEKTGSGCSYSSALRQGRWTYKETVHSFDVDNNRCSTMRTSVQDTVGLFFMVGVLETLSTLRKTLFTFVFSMFETQVSKPMHCLIREAIHFILRHTVWLYFKPHHNGFFSPLEWIQSAFLHSEFQSPNISCQHVKDFSLLFGSCLLRIAELGMGYRFRNTWNQIT